MLMKKSVNGVPPPSVVLASPGAERSEAERSDAERSVAPGEAKTMPDPEVVVRAKRRQYSAEYKKRILAEADSANAQNPTDPYFGLVDEGAKLNLNNVNTNVLSYLPNMSQDFANAIMDWRGTNGIVSLNYASSGYSAKNAQFETVDELRLVYGADNNLLYGEDLNLNGILDKNEKDLNGNGELDSRLVRPRARCVG